MELLFVVAKIIGSPDKNDSLLFHSKLLCVIMTTTIQNTVAFVNA